MNWNSIDSVRSVHSSLEGWAIVFFALLVLFDVLAHFSEDTHKERAKKFERIGLCCFGVAVLAELIAYPYSRRNDELSGTEIRELSAVSKQARLDAEAATRKAKSASDEADAAKAEADTANGTARASKDMSLGAVSISGKAEARAEEVSVRTDRANAALTTLEARIAKAFGARHLTEHGRKDLADRMQNFTGVQVDVFLFINDQWDKEEALPFAESVTKTLENTPLDAIGLAPWPYCALSGFVG